MLKAAIGKQVDFDNDHNNDLSYVVADATIRIIDGTNAAIRARLVGPAGERVMGRAWISDEHGGLAESPTVEVESGSFADFPMQIKFRDHRTVTLSPVFG